MMQQKSYFIVCSYASYANIEVSVQVLWLVNSAQFYLDCLRSYGAHSCIGGLARVPLLELQQPSMQVTQLTARWVLSSKVFCWPAEVLMSFPFFKHFHGYVNPPGEWMG